MMGLLPETTGRLNNALSHLQTLKINTMTYLTLPKRVFNSPLIEYANFRNGTFVNLIRLKKPYANGDSYAVYETTRSPFCSNGLFKTIEEAEKKYNLMVKNGSKNNPVIKQGEILKNKL